MCLISWWFFCHWYSNSPSHPPYMSFLLQRNSAGSENPSDVFRFLVEERVQCCQTRRVRYTQRVDYCIQLPAPIEAATNRGKEAPINKYAHTHGAAAVGSRSCLWLVQLGRCWAQVAPATGSIIRFCSERVQKVLRCQTESCVCV